MNATATTKRFENITQSNQKKPEIEKVERLGFTTGIKARFTSLKEFAKAADLSWKALELPVYTTIDGKQVQLTDRKALIRDDNHEVLADVRASYGVVQPEVMFDMADAIIRAEDGEWQIGQGGSTGGGARIWMQLRGQPRDVGGEKVESHLTFGNSFDCTLAYAAGFSNVWAVCQNTLAAALHDAQNQLVLKHSKNVSERVSEIKEILDSARKYNAAIDAEVLKLMRTRITEKTVWALAAKLFPASNELKVSEKTKELRALFMDGYLHAPGAAVGTAWGALQATTYYGTHRWVIKGASAQAAQALRVESNLFPKERANRFQQLGWDSLTRPGGIEQLARAEVWAGA